MIAAGGIRGRLAAPALVGRVVSGTIFVVFGVGKFVQHSSEVNSFASYGLPSPDAFVYSIGVLELIAGALLITGLATRIAAVMLAGDMVGAIIVSGIAKGETVSLTVAPALLVVCLLLIWAGPGRYACGGRARRPRRSDVGLPDADVRER